MDDQLVQRLLERNAALEAENTHLRERGAALEARVAELLATLEALNRENQQLRDRLGDAERAAARQAAPFRRRQQKKVPPGERRRPGQKPGHPGHCRRVPAQVDQTVEVPLECCPKCGGVVLGKHRVEQYIEELPPVRPQVTKVVTYQGECPQCGEVRSTHPQQTSLGQGAAKVQLGPRALAWAAALNKQYGLTMRTCCRVLQGLAGLRITPGGLSQALTRVAGKVRHRYQKLIEQLRSSPAVFADETSWWVGGPGWWLWTFTTPEATLYRVDPSRGSQVVRETLGEAFGGMLVSDCLASYDPPPYRKHKCIAHHQRAIAEARRSLGDADPSYLDSWKQLFQVVSVLHKTRSVMGAENFAQRRTHLEAWCDALLAEPREHHAEQAIQNRLRKQRAHLFGCLYEPAAEPTNNRAERALRPAVMARKLSCGNKTPAGRDCWETLASLAATCQQGAADFITELLPHLSLAPAAS